MVYIYSTMLQDTHQLELLGKISINPQPKLQIVLTWTNGDKALCGADI